jgi:hypothetical protein
MPSKGTGRNSGGKEPENSPVEDPMCVGDCLGARAAAYRPRANAAPVRKYVVSAIDKGDDGPHNHVYVTSVMCRYPGEATWQIVRF